VLTPYEVRKALREELRKFIGEEFTLPLYSMRSVGVDKGGRVFAGTSYPPATLYRLDEWFDEPVKILEDGTQDYFGDIFLDKDGNVFVAGRSSTNKAKLYKIKPDGTLKQVLETTFVNARIKSLTQDVEGRIYCCTTGARNVFYVSEDAGETWKVLLDVVSPVPQYPDTNAACIATPDDEYLFVSYWQNGVDIFRRYYYPTASWVNMPSITNHFIYYALGSGRAPLLISSERGAFKLYKWHTATPSIDAICYLLALPQDMWSHIGTYYSKPWRGIWLSQKGITYLGYGPYRPVSLSPLCASPDLGDTWIPIFDPGIYGGVFNLGFWRGYVFIAIGTSLSQATPQLLSQPGWVTVIKEPSLANLYEMAQSWTDTLFDRKEIRDTIERECLYDREYDTYRVYKRICLKAFRRVTIAYENTLDQDVTVKVEGSPNPGFTTAVTSVRTLSILSGVSGWETLTDFFPYIRCKVKANAIPTSGDLSLRVMKAK